MDSTTLDPACQPPPIIERAYQLAESGQFASVPEICDRLIAEGYEEVHLHFEARAALRSNLAHICQRSRRASHLKVASRSGPAEHAVRSRPRNARRFALKAVE